MRDNIIAFGLLAILGTAEIWVLNVSGEDLYQILVRPTGECRGITIDYNRHFGSSSWDCDGNRLPDERSDNVDAQVSYDPQAAIVRYPPALSGTPRDRRQFAPRPGDPGWRP